MIKVIIFDLDGTLIDSQPLQYKAYNSVFSAHGYPLGKQEWDEWIQGSYSPKIWIERHSLPLDFEKIRAEKKVIYDRLIAEEMTLKPGALDLINALHGRYRLCIASSSRIESVRLCLEKFNLTAKFEKLFSDSGMDKGKPFPDLFLKAASEMGARPEECLVIEDSIAGLQAAKSAKMKYIICPDTYCNIPHSKFGGADKVVDSLAEVTEKMINEM